MAKIVVLELGFEDDEDAQRFSDALNKGETETVFPLIKYADVIENRVENP